MRIRFEIQSLAALGEGVHRLPVNCWRLTLLYSGSANGLIDGQNLVGDLFAGGLTALGRIVVGGVFDASGAPVNLDQVIVLTVVPGKTSRGVMIYEYLEP